MASQKPGRMAETVTISVADYESLAATRRKYLSLKQALLAGGVTTETLNVLISGSFPPTPPDEDLSSSKISTNAATGEDTSSLAPMPTARSLIPGARSTKSSNPYEHVSHLQKHFASWIPSQFTPDYTDEGVMQEELVQVSREQTFDKLNHAKRSLEITGLSPATTLHSLVQVLKGGAILQMYLRDRDCSAHVSFVDPAAANNFLRYAQTNDICVQGKKVNVAWDSQQTRMQQSLARCVESFGGTRNLVIRFARPAMTAESIREDLDHIHRLEVVDLFFANNHAYISLNSIRSALTARNCMLSRLKYKRIKIDFYPDECAQPLPSPRTGLWHKTSDIKPAGISHRNRFEVLFDGFQEKQALSETVDP